SVDINKSTSYAGVAGGSAKDQPNVNSNFRTLVAGPVFDGVNISIPRKVVEKASLRADLEVNSEADLMDVVTIGIPSLSEDDFTKETIKDEGRSGNVFEESANLNFKTQKKLVEVHLSRLLLVSLFSCVMCSSCN
ncbi:hypothetical protein Tco_1278757, partial [Tanacetum coccineum]